MGQWFRLHVSTAGVTVQSLVWDLRTHNPCGTATNNNTTTTKTRILEIKASSARLQLGDLVGAGGGGWGVVRLHYDLQFPHVENGMTILIIIIMPSGAWKDGR